jgi:hypothetical protein
MTPPKNATVTSIEISFTRVPTLYFLGFLLGHGFIDFPSPESVISRFIHDAVSSRFVNLSAFDP